MHSEPVLDTEWRHVALVIDREAERIFGFVNGSNAGWSTATGLASNSLEGFGSMATTSSLYIGAVDGDGGIAMNYAKGMVDDARIYDRALTEQQIRAIMDALPD
jgi:hypothetical protein